MRGWPILLGGLAIWAAHFLLVYALGEFAGEAMTVRMVILLLTLAAIIGEVAMFVMAMRAEDRMHAQIGTLGAVLGGLAIVWQTLPVLF